MLILSVKLSKSRITHFQTVRGAHGQLDTIIDITGYCATVEHCLYARRASERIQLRAYVCVL